MSTKDGFTRDASHKRDSWPEAYKTAEDVCAVVSFTKQLQHPDVGHLVVFKSDLKDCKVSQSDECRDNKARWACASGWSAHITCPESECPLYLNPDFRLTPDEIAEIDVRSLQARCARMQKSFLARIAATNDMWLLHGLFPLASTVI